MTQTAEAASNIASRLTWAATNGGLAPLASTDRRLSRVLTHSASSKSLVREATPSRVGGSLSIGRQSCSVGGAFSLVSTSTALGRFRSTWPRSGFGAACVSFRHEPKAAMMRAFSSSRGRSPTATTIEVSGRYQRW